jgi:hypothetical protein
MDDSENKPRSRFKKNRGATPDGDGSPDNAAPLSNKSGEVEKKPEMKPSASSHSVVDDQPHPKESNSGRNKESAEKHKPPVVNLPEKSLANEERPSLYSEPDERPLSPDIKSDDEDFDEDFDEETGLLIRNDENQKKIDEEIHKLPPQDIASQNNRIKRLRDLSDTYPFRLFYSCTTTCLKAGYDIQALYRIARFADVHKGLNLFKATDGLDIGIDIKGISTYKNHIIGLVKPFVRVYALNVETGLFVQSANEQPLKPVKTKSKLATHNCSKVSWNEEIVLNAPFVDLASESTVLLFEIIDQRSSLKLKRKNTTQGGDSGYTYRKTAWAYLLPVGIDGRLNIPYYNRLEQNKEQQPNNEPLNRIDTASTLNLNLPLQQSPVPPFEETPEYKTNEHIDSHYKLQLFSYHDYDGMIGLIQRKFLAWPDLNPYVTRY